MDTSSAFVSGLFRCYIADISSAGPRIACPITSRSSMSDIHIDAVYRIIDASKTFGAQRRARAVGAFPDRASALRLVTAAALETTDLWADRRYLGSLPPLVSGDRQGSLAGRSRGSSVSCFWTHGSGLDRAGMGIARESSPTSKGVFSDASLRSAGDPGSSRTYGLPHDGYRLHDAVEMLDLLRVMDIS